MHTRKHLHFAMTNNLPTEINECLTNSPDLLKEETKAESSAFLEVAVLGHFEVIETILSNPAYKMLRMQERQELLRDVVAGGVEHTLQLYSKGKISESSKALDKLLAWNQTILEKTSEDYSLYHFTLYLFAILNLTQKNMPGAMQALQDAIFIGEKITSPTDQDNYTLMYCYNALGKCYVRMQEYEEAMTCFHKARQCCQKLSQHEPRKAKLLVDLDENATLLAGFSLTQKAQGLSGEFYMQKGEGKSEEKAEFPSKLAPHGSELQSVSTIKDSPVPRHKHKRPRTELQETPRLFSGSGVSRPKVVEETGSVYQIPTPVNGVINRVR